MKILFITLEYPPQKGGVASYYGGLVEELRRQGHEVEIVSSGLLSKWIWPRWLKAYFLVRKKLKIYGDPISVATETGSPAITLFVGQILSLGTIAYLLRKRVPYIVFVHGMDVLMAQRSWRKCWLVRRIFQHAKLIVANSEFTVKQIENLKLSFCPRRHTKAQLWPTTAVVYPCPTIASDVKQDEVEALRRKLGLSGKKVMLTLGRVVERKGHDLVIKALPEILQHVPEAVYVVAGEGPDLGRLYKLAQQYSLSGAERSEAESKGAFDKLRQYPGAVRFVGAVSDEERPLYYALCDLFVMPSRQIGADVEGFGLSFLEAALFGKPSIGGRSGGIPEAILDGKTGALVDPADASALTRVIVQLLRDDGLRHEIGQNAKARVMHEFRWENQAGVLINRIDLMRKTRYDR